MDKDGMLGWFIIGSALSCITYLVFWSRRMIDRIANKKLHSAREILRDQHDGR